MGWGEVTGLVCVLIWFDKLPLKMKQAKVDQELYKTECEREKASKTTDCSQQDLFSLHSRSQHGCVAASPAGIPLPCPVHPQHFITSTRTRACRVSACWQLLSSPPAISLQPKKPILQYWQSATLFIKQNNSDIERMNHNLTTMRGEESHCKPCVWELLLAVCVPETGPSPTVVADKSWRPHITRH